jgi:hypothetical protein
MGDRFDPTFLPSKIADANKFVGMQLKIKMSMHMKSDRLQFAVVIRDAYMVLSRDMI